MEFLGSFSSIISYTQQTVLWVLLICICFFFFQVFLHLSTLERCVTWSRSVLNARCRICRRKCDPEKMLLCDGCDRGHHMYCLKPKVKVTPLTEIQFDHALTLQSDMPITRCQFPIHCVSATVLSIYISGASVQPHCVCTRINFDILSLYHLTHGWRRLGHLLKATTS